MTPDPTEAQASAAILERIAKEIRPKLEDRPSEGGYNCCGCSTYEEIIEDIETIVREETA